MSDFALEMLGISKSYPGVKVLDDVSFDLLPGEVHALMGENGAGKSTLMKVLMGLVRADSGTVRVAGEPVEISTPRQAIAHGIAMIHQELNPVLDMTVYENVFLGRERRAGRFLADRRAMRAETATILGSLGLRIPPEALMRDLSVAQRQQVEIAKAVSQNASVLIMDEPTSAITEDDVARLFQQVRRLTSQGVAVIYISHKMSEIFEVSDRITVLRDGALIGTRPAAGLDEPTLIKMMVGRDLDEAFPKRQVALGEVALEVRGWNAPPQVKDVNLYVRSGEVLGVGGLVGAGRSELAESVFGFRRHQAGTLYRNGREVRIGSPKEAVRQGLALVTEDRKATGLNLRGTVAENITLPSLSRLFPRGLLNRARESEVVARYLERLRIKASSPQQDTASLSGGNQQKVVLAKWLETAPEVVILDEPTRGIDVAAKRDVYEIIGDLVAGGCAVVLISSEMPELMGLSDRIVVLAEGRTVGALERQEFSQEALMELASRFEK